VARDLLFELGAEELPARFVVPALSDLQRMLVEQLASAGLSHGEVKTYGTPRRLAVHVAGLQERTEDVRKDALGPPVRAAFDKDGKPTKAAEKFAEGLGLRVDQLKRVNTPKGEYLAAEVEEKGRTAQAILQGALHDVVHKLGFPKGMRWGDVEASFARPLHWIIALFGDEVIPVTFGDVKSGRTTVGHRFLAPAAITLNAPAEYLPALSAAHVMPDVAARRALLVERLLAAAQRAGGTLIEDEALVDQVVNLVELPNPVVGNFEARHLDLPPEVLVQEMKSHQRYFSLKGADGRLMPKFIAVSNTPVKDEALSLRGYERVLRARLTDGRFFFDEDRKIPLESRVEKLGRVVYQQKLGTYLEKVERFRALAKDLAEKTGHHALHDTVDRAAWLCKADLVTGMVGEFPELQGVMGREYARVSGEADAVAVAIFEHYLPRGSGDALPSTDAGALLGLADRLDTLCGIFGIGKPPTGAADPFGLRRACLGIIHVILSRGYRLSLSAAVELSLALLAGKLKDVKPKAGDLPLRDQVMDFFRGRLKSLWSESHRGDVVEAVLAAGFDDVVGAGKRVQALDALVGRADFAPLAAAFKRVVNIVQKQGKDVGAGAVDPARLEDEAEKRLFQEVAAVRERVTGLLGRDDFAGALKEITSLKPAVDLFFEKVMVMAEDRALRENRVRLLVEIGALFSPVADFSKIQAEA
jgi:glycyl-tRNA synthetase beta chain